MHELTSSTNDQIMAMAAHRYCLGRMTYVVGACVEWVRARWTELEPNTQNVMLRDTLEALASNNAGHECDVRDWTGLAQWMWSRMTPEQQEWVTDAVRHRPGAILFAKDLAKDLLA